MSQPTPGPLEVYEVEDDGVVVARGVRQVGGKGLNHGTEFELFTKADATLFAAAPRMLDQLKILVGATCNCASCIEIRDIITTIEGASK